MGKLDGHWHQFFCLIAGKPKHQALVASSAGIYAHGNIRRLPLHGAQDRASIAVVAVLRAIIADTANRAANHLVIIHVRAGGNFTGDDRHARRNQRFTGNAAFGVLPHDLVKNGVRNLVGNFVRMPLGHRFRRK